MLLTPILTFFLARNTAPKMTLYCCWIINFHHQTPTYTPTTQAKNVANFLEHDFNVRFICWKLKCHRFYKITNFVKDSFNELDERIFAKRKKQHLYPAMLKNFFLLSELNFDILNIS